jgi:hypothetical protein
VHSSLQIQAINKDLDEFRRYPCPQSPRFGCDVNKVPQTKDLTPAQKEYVRLQQEEGDRFATLQWVFYGSAIALGVTSGVLFFLGYAGSDDAQASRDGGFTLGVAPFVGPAGAGVSAGLKF